MCSVQCAVYISTRAPPPSSSPPLYTHLARLEHVLERLPLSHDRVAVPSWVVEHDHVEILQRRVLEVRGAPRRGLRLAVRRAAAAVARVHGAADEEAFARVLLRRRRPQPRLDGDAEALLVVRQHTAEEVAHAGLQGDAGEFGGGVVVVDLQPEADLGEGEAVVEL